jgi:hypothetical protein
MNAFYLQYITMDKIISTNLEIYSSISVSSTGIIGIGLFVDNQYDRSFLLA